MSAMVEIAFPCDLVTAELTVVPDGGLTAMEQAVIGAIGTGRNRVERIADFLGLHQRMVLDVLHGVWVRGHVTIDFGTTVVDLSAEARSWLRDPASHDLASGAIDRVSWTYLHEPVSGSVLTSNRSSRVDDRAVRMPRSQQHAFRDVPRERLIRRLQADLEDRGVAMARRIVGVSLSSAGQMPSPPDRFVLADAMVSTLPNGDLRIRLVRESFGDDSARRRLERHVNGLCVAEPRSTFATRLRAESGSSSLRPPDPARAVLERMRRRLDATLEVEQNQLLLKRREVLDDDAELQSAIRGEVSAAVSAEVFSGHDKLLNAAASLLAEAEAQVVLASPIIRYTAISALYDDLDDALARDVHIVFLWGERSTSRLDDRVATLFAELRRQHSDRILWSPRPAEATPRFAVRDASEALVGSASPLECSGPDPGTRFGVLIGPSEFAAGGAAFIHDLLAFAKSQFPDYELSQLLRTDFASHHLREVELGVPDRLLRQELDTINVATWVSAWHEVLRQRTHLLDLLEEAPAARVVSAVAYRALLAAGLEGDGRVVIAGKRIRADRQEPALRTLLQSTEASLDVIAREHDLEGVLGERVNWTHHPSFVDGGIVVAEGAVVLTAFDPLATDLAPAEVGATIELGGDALVAGVLASIGVSTATIVGETAPTRRSTVSLEPLDQLLELQSLEPEARITRLDEILTASTDPVALLDRWKEGGADDRLLRAAAGRLILDVADATWTRWLIDDALMGQRFVEAMAVALGSRAGPAAAMIDALCLLAPLDGLYLGAERTAEAALGAVDGLDPDEPARAGALLGALAEVMARPATSDLEAIAVLADGVLDPVSELVQAVAAYVSEMPVPVPMENLRARVDIATAQQETERRWQDIGSSIQQLRNNDARWDFDTGEGLHAALFADDGMLTRIHRAATDPAARIDLGLNIPKPAAVKRHVDDLIRRADLAAMEWGRQAGYLQRLERLVRDANRAAARAEVEVGNATDPHLFAALTRLADALAVPLEDLRAGAANLGHFSGAAIRFKSRLEPLIAWREIIR